jgi:hypothetical protein
VIETTLKLKGQEASTQKESHRYSFDWDSASGGK